ncbi:hypothetical protein [Sneathiella glossodoripedis]|uniref:hypothetical protein n=1 Tax=Sneathiella glossodoripedis TaxID=418853 RepID=UPI0011DD0FD4|nr:hypothetical protein [Sneathiella glossodoripedis]
MKKLLLVLLLGGCATNYETADKPVWIDEQAAIVAAYRSDKTQHYKVEIYPTDGEKKLLQAGAHKPTLWRLIRSLDKTCKLPTAQQDLAKGWKYEYELFSDVTGKLVSRIFYTAKECDIELDQVS